MAKHPPVGSHPVGTSPEVFDEIATKITANYQQGTYKTVVNTVLSDEELMWLAGVLYYDFGFTFNYQLLQYTYPKYTELVVVLPD